MKEWWSSDDEIEGWAYAVDGETHELQILDHTFVKAPNNGPAYFDCFGGHDKPDAHPLDGAAGKGNYAIANRYRFPFAGRPDTAGLGVYAIHGVCHQAANRFLWSTCGWFGGPTVKNARAYLLSFSFYGTYGRPIYAPPPSVVIPPRIEPPTDFLAMYRKFKLFKKTPKSEEDSSATPKEFDQRVIAPHQNLRTKQKKYDPNAVINEELRFLVEDRLGSKFEFAKIQEIRNRAIERAHKVATSDLRGEAFAHEINAIAVQYLDEMESHLGSDHYSRLLSIPPKERYALVDPALAEQAGSHGTRAK